MHNPIEALFLFVIEIIRAAIARVGNFVSSSMGFIHGLMAAGILVLVFSIISNNSKSNDYTITGFNGSTYIHDTRTDLCYLSYLHTGRAHYLLVPCSDSVMSIAEELPR